MYYCITITAVILFGGCFVIRDFYRKIRGASGLKMALETTFFGSFGSITVLLLFNCISFKDGLNFDISGVNPGFTAFTLLMAALSVANGFAFTYCSFKALNNINLSVFSLFSMIGGMLLPFIHGILFYGEKITLAKIICVAFIFVALILTLDMKKDTPKKRGCIYCVGIFIFNGMSGILSKIFSSSNLPKTTNTGYSIWVAFISGAVSAVVLFLFFKKKGENELPYTLKAVLLSGGSGALNKTANFMLLLALSGGIDSSAQYPLVTGGVMIVSTLACFLTGNKPSRKEIISVCLAFFGTFALFIVPDVIIF